MRPRTDVLVRGFIEERKAKMSTRDFQPLMHTNRHGPEKSHAGGENFARLPAVASAKAGSALECGDLATPFISNPQPASLPNIRSVHVTGFGADGTRQTPVIDLSELESRANSVST
jgi:hypothetical protein